MAEQHQQELQEGSSFLPTSPSLINTPMPWLDLTSNTIAVPSTPRGVFNQPALDLEQLEQDLTLDDIEFMKRLDKVAASQPVDLEKFDFDFSDFNNSSFLPTSTAPSNQHCSAVDNFFDMADYSMDIASMMQAVSNPTQTQTAPATQKPVSPKVPKVSSTLSSSTTAKDGKIRKRRPKQCVPEHLKDEKYYERRRKNTEAARRNRALKKQSELLKQSRLPALEKEKEELVDEVALLQEELKHLREAVRARLLSLQQ